MAHVPIEVFELNPPPHEAVASALEGELRRNFAEVTVSVQKAPDLREHPYGLVGPGLNGSPCIIDVGGIDNLFPKPDISREYCMKQIAEQIGFSNPVQFIGAGSCGYSRIGRNSELVMNANAQTSKSMCFKMSEDHKRCEAEHYDGTSCSALCNVLCSQGSSSGDVIFFRAKTRISSDGRDVVACLQRGLQQGFGTTPISIGGVFCMTAGAAKIHVMSDFTVTPIRTQDFIDDHWLKYFTAKAPFTYMFVCTSVDPPNFNMRLTHTHGHESVAASDVPQIGGHYHHDEGEEVEYVGYCTLAERIYRVDKVGQTPNWDKPLTFPTNTTSAHGTPVPPPTSIRGD